MRRLLSAPVVVVVVAGCGCDGAVPPVEEGVIATGSAPNAIALTTCDGGQRALVPASQGASLNVFDTTSGTRSDVDLGAGSTPWAVAVLPEAERAVVTLFGAHGVALVDPCGGSVVDAVTASDVVVSVDDVVLRHSIEGIGAIGATISEMPLRSPEAVAVDDQGRVWVTFVNLLEVAEPAGPMELGNGVVARFVVDGDQLVLDDHRETFCLNPQGIAVSGARVVVTCTGRFGSDGDGLFAIDGGGGIVVYDADSLEELARRSDPNSWGTPAVVDDLVVVGDVLGGVVASFAIEDLDDRDVQDIAGDDESIFKILVVDGEAVALRFLNGDAVFDPFRTGRAVRIGDPLQPPRGLIDLAVDDDGAGWAVFSLSAELVKVDPL